jgi:hypothetical protein
MRFSENTPWYKRLWYTYTLLIAWLFFEYIYSPLEKRVINLAYKWKYRKEHREMRRKYRL